MRDNDILRKGASDMVLLLLLSEKDMYGYELRKVISERSSSLFQISEGTMYVYLYRLSENGYISERRELVGKRRFRVIYSIENEGKEYLKNLLADFFPAQKGFNRLLCATLKDNYPTDLD